MGGGHGPVHTTPEQHVSLEETWVDKTPRPPIGSIEHQEDPGFWNKNPTPADAQPRTVWQRFHKVMKFDLFESGDNLVDTISHKKKEYDGITDWIWGSTFPKKSPMYTDPYLHPNRCPEEYIGETYKWPRMKVVNPKIPPPIDGKYNDYYHMIAFRHWFDMERRVYIAACQEVEWTTTMCMLKEHVQINAAKNCRHLFHKWFAMSRAEEFNQTMLYMALTGNCAIRETPYPADFVEQKRKIWDDWLFRTRHKRPTDDWLAVDSNVNEVSHKKI